ncbi:MAG: hypothetical protein K2O03_07385 [Lachnospiraceae bacterium]|nr:hypothetical protein [Lachnospiraceae bacterium]
MNQSRYHMNIGGASILLLITVFALTVFAVLSIRASYSERQMAERGRDAVERYYEADTKAEEVYAKLLDAFLAAGAGRTAASVLEAAQLPAEVMADAKENQIIYSIGVDYNRTLRIVLELSGEKCQVREWRLISTASGSYEEEMEIWDGVFTN